MGGAGVKSRPCSVHTSSPATLAVTKLEVCASGAPGRCLNLQHGSPVGADWIHHASCARRNKRILHRSPWCVKGSAVLQSGILHGRLGAKATEMTCGRATLRASSKPERRLTIERPGGAMRQTDAVLLVLRFIASRQQVEACCSILADRELRLPGDWRV